MDLKLRRGFQVKYKLCTSLGFSEAVKKQFRVNRLINDLRRRFLSRSTNLTTILTNELQSLKLNIEPNELEIVRDLESDQDITSIVRIFRSSVLDKQLADVKIDELVNLSWKSKVEQVRKKVPNGPLEIKVKEISDLQEISDNDNSKEKLKSQKKKKNFHVALVCDMNSKYSLTRYEKVEVRESGKLYCSGMEVFEVSNLGAFERFIDSDDRLNTALNEFQFSSTSSYQGK